MVGIEGPQMSISIIPVCCVRVGTEYDGGSGEITFFVCER